MKSMTKHELESFKRDITNLCSSYGVLIRRQGEKRDNPKPEAIYFYEMELSAKINPNGEVVYETVRNL